MNVFDRCGFFEKDIIKTVSQYEINDFEINIFVCFSFNPTWYALEVGLIFIVFDKINFIVLMNC